MKQACYLFIVVGNTTMKRHFELWFLSVWLIFVSVFFTLQKLNLWVKFTLVFFLLFLLLFLHFLGIHLSVGSLVSAIIIVGCTYRRIVQFHLQTVCKVWTFEHICTWCMHINRQPSTDDDGPNCRAFNCKYMLNCSSSRNWCVQNE